MGGDKIVHFVLFAGFGGLWMRALCSPVDGAWRQCRRRAVALLVVGGLFAGGSEIYQDLLPIRRSGDPYDAVANGAGLLVSILLYGIIWGRTQRGAWGGKPSGA